MSEDKKGLKEFLLEFGEELLSNGDSSELETFKNVTQFRATITGESDRGCALMAAAYIDERLGLLIQAYLVDDAKVTKKLFDFNSAFGTFSSKIDTSYGLGLISKNVYYDLTLLRKIRNDFAHVSKPISFDDQPIKSRCHELSLYPNSSEMTPRMMFCRSMSIAVTQIEICKSELKRCEVREDYDGKTISDLVKPFAKKLTELFDHDLEKYL